MKIQLLGKRAKERETLLQGQLGVWSSPKATNSSVPPESALPLLWDHSQRNLGKVSRRDQQDRGDLGLPGGHGGARAPTHSRGSFPCRQRRAFLGHHPRRSPHGNCFVSSQTF